MKSLKKLLLINWYFFDLEIIEFDKINFITGKNAAGKTTIIDALQVVLLGDSNGRKFFNKAANDRSARSLKGYLRCEIGDDSAGGFRYLREGRFTSYIVCEFYDDVKKESFCLGVVFDCYADGSDEHHFFTLSAAIPQQQFIHDRTPMTAKELRAFVNGAYKRGKYSFPDTDRSFQEELKGRLGGLKDKYFSLLKKAVSFTPITEIEPFITDYVCDVKAPVDISLMQDNIRAYKRLEADAELVEARVGVLESIETRFQEYAESRQLAVVQQYIIDRGRLEQAVSREQVLKSEIGAREEEFVSLSRDAAECEAALAAEKENYAKLISDRAASDISATYDRLSGLREEQQGKITAADAAAESAVQKLRGHGVVWSRAARRVLEGEGAELTEAGPATRLADRGEACVLMAQKLETRGQALASLDKKDLSSLTLARFNEIFGELKRAGEAANELRYSLTAEIDDREKKIRVNDTLLKNLKSGIKGYDPKLLEFRKTLEQELSKLHGVKVRAHIVADLLEIKEPRWKNAIEAYLHTQKFYIIVDRKYFVDALKIYDALKFERNFHSFGLVDTEKMAKEKVTLEPCCWAEEVTTGNREAQTFINFSLGKVVKCDRVEDLRNFRRAITDSCMLYQGFVARQLSPERWRFPYIGRSAVAEQIFLLEQENSRLLEEKSALTARLEQYSGLAALTPMGEYEADSYCRAAAGYGQIPAFREALAKIEEEISGLNLQWLEGIDQRIGDSQDHITTLDQASRSYIGRLSRLDEQINQLKSEKLTVAAAQIADCRQRLQETYEPEFAQTVGEPRFSRERRGRPDLAEMLANFSRALEGTKSRRDCRKNARELERSRYNADYQMSYDFQSEDNEAYGRELQELRDLKLPQYKAQISDAKEKAYQQFSEDFISKLKSNIDMVREQINDLNKALSESFWGQERYRFTWAARPEYKSYYDMITDSMLMEGNNLASAAFTGKYADTISELFRNITEVDYENDADKREEVAKNIKRFTDYRTYLTFDLEVTDSEGGKQKLSKTMKKKSGGETQTPFYISVLASFAQLYRLRDKTINRIGLILFDEAFSKMDGERIKESVRLLQKFGFQCILSAPPEKVGEIAPLVDRNLCVIREGYKSTVKAFLPRDFEEEAVR